MRGKEKGEKEKTGGCLPPRWISSRIGSLSCNQTRSDPLQRTMNRESAALLTVADVAARLRVPPDRVRAWLKSGQLAGIRLGGRRTGWRITPAAVDAMLTALRQGVERQEVILAADGGDADGHSAMRPSDAS